MGRNRRAQVVPGGTLGRGPPAPPPPPRRPEAAHLAPDAGQPRPRWRVRRRLVGDRDRRHLGAHRRRAPLPLQRRDAVRLRHGVAVDPHGGRDLQHLLARHQRPPRHPPDRRRPHPRPDRRAGDHQHPASGVGGVHRVAHLHRLGCARPHLAECQRVREGLHRSRRGASARRRLPRRGPAPADGTRERGDPDRGRWDRTARRGPHDRRCAPARRWRSSGRGRQRDHLRSLVAQPGARSHRRAPGPCPGRGAGPDGGTRPRLGAPDSCADPTLL